MNTFWPKIIGIAIVVVGVILLVNFLSSPDTEPKPKPKTFQDVIKEDDVRLRAEPKPSEETQAIADKTTALKESVPAQPQFRELEETERVDAERYFNMALQQRKIGRLPGTSYKVMVDCCRYIIQKYPGSVYAFKAKRMLADIPAQYRDRYKITAEEIDLGGFE